MPLGQSQPAGSVRPSGRQWYTLFKRGKTALGLMTPRRKLASAAYYPSFKARRILRGGKCPFWFQVKYASIPANDTQDGSITFAKGFNLVSIMGNQSQGAASSQTQFYHQVSTGKGIRLSRIGIIDTCFAGIGKSPFMLRRPYPIGSYTMVLNRTQNLSANANTVQFVLYGLSE